MDPNKLKLQCVTFLSNRLHACSIIQVRNPQKVYNLWKPPAERTVGYFTLFIFSSMKDRQVKKIPTFINVLWRHQRGCKESEHHLNASPAWLSWSVRPDTAESLTRPNQDQDPYKRSVSSVSVWLDRETNRNRLTRLPGLIRESEPWKSPGSSILEKVKFPSPKQSTA